MSAGTSAPGGAARWPAGQPVAATLVARALLRSLVVVVLGFVAGPGARALDSASDLRATLREHLRSPQFALERKPEYVITEPAVVEPALDYALRFADPARPPDPAALARLKASAVTGFSHELTRPAGLRALEARIRERFARPVVTRARNEGSSSGEALNLDLGWMPGELSRRFWGVEMTGHGENFENGKPASAFMARLLAGALREYPDAERVTLKFRSPRFGRRGDYELTYRRGGFPESRHGWVELSSTNAVGLAGPYEVPAIGEDFSPYLDGRFSFYQNCSELLYRATDSQRAQFLAQLSGKCVNAVAAGAR